jgi:hypothetical protein
MASPAAEHATLTGQKHLNTSDLLPVSQLVEILSSFPKACVSVDKAAALVHHFAQREQPHNSNELRLV